MGGLSGAANIEAVIFLRERFYVRVTDESFGKSTL
jgi:hypothetical protein